MRLAPYSYDLVDNLGRDRRASCATCPSRSRATPFTHAFGRPQGQVVTLVPGEELTARIMGAHMSYTVVPQCGAATRLLVWVVMSSPPPWSETS